MKWIRKLFESIAENMPFQGGRKSKMLLMQIRHIVETSESNKIFAEIDNDLINQINKAERDFKQSQSKYIPCQILHYNKRIQRLRMERIKAFLMENKSLYIPERRYEDGSYRGGYYYRENTNFIKKKESK